MARLMEGGTSPGGRKLSFKTKGQGERRPGFRATRVTVPSSKVAELASKFSAVVVEEERGRELLRRLQGGGEGSVRAAVRALENNLADQQPKVVLVRRTEPRPKEKTAPDKKTFIPAKEKRLSIPKDHTILESVLNENPRPNPSFLWRPRSDEFKENLEADQGGYGKIDNLKSRPEPNEKPDRDKKILPPEPSYFEKNKSDEDPQGIKPEVLRDKNGVLLRTNSSTLFKNIVNSEVSCPPLNEEIPKDTREPVMPRSSFLHGLRNSQVKEDETDNYEIVGSENNYAVIQEEEEYDSEEAIYDDVVNVKTSIVASESHYETVSNHNDSDSSWDQSNSLYGARPSSRASTVSGAVASGASRSDTSDDWVDLEAEERVLVLRGRNRNRGQTGKWSQKVRRQWSKRAADLEQCDSDSSSGKHYEVVNNIDDDSALYDDFDDSSDSESSYDKENKVDLHQNYSPAPAQSEGIYGLMREAGKKVRKTSWSIGQSLRRFSRMTSAPSSSVNNENGEPTVNLRRGRWSSLKKFRNQKATSTFYLKEPENPPVKKLPPPPPLKTDSNPDMRRYSLAVRPSSPPPPPPPLRLNGDASKRKPINDTTWYTECGLFDNSNTNGESRRPRPSSNSWYSDIGLYENNRPSDSASEHSSSHGSDLNLRFADEPLYQFYAATVAQMERTEYEGGSDYDCYEEIGTNGAEPKELSSRPSALELVTPGIHRSLWSQVPQVVSSGILETLVPMQQKLQEAKFELMTSEASYYKSLTVLEKHFASSVQFKDESILPKLHYKTLFCNVAPIRKCSELVLGALEKCWQDSIMLDGVCGLIYQLSQQHFQAYVKYCTNQVSIESTLRKLKQENSAFVEALTTLESSSQCQSLSLYSFLLLPMQRVTRMPLLLDAILTKLDSDHPEYDNCRLALAHLNKVVHECNEAARRTERYEEMAVLSRALVFPSGLRPLPLLSASRWLVRSGPVTQINLDAKLTFSRKLTARNTKLTLFLFTDYLIIAKKKGEDVFSVVDYCLRSLIQMSEMEDAISNKFLIMLTMLENHEGKTQEMVLCCGSESSRERWLQALSSPHSSNPEETLYADWDCPQVAASHSYTPSQPDELHLQQGDVVNVLRKMHDGWYYGERIRDGEKGWFPGNHSVEIASQHVKARNLKLRYRLLALSANYLQQQQKLKNNS